MLPAVHIVWLGFDPFGDVIVGATGGAVTVMLYEAVAGLPVAHAAFDVKSTRITVAPGFVFGSMYVELAPD